MPASPSRRFPKWRILLAIVLLTGAGAWAFVNHPWVHAQMDLKLAEAIQRELGLDAAIGPVRVELPLSLVANSIQLSHPQHGLLASAERLEVTPSLFDLLLGEVVIQRVTIEGAKVRLRIEQGQIVNLPKLPDVGDDDGLSWFGTTRRLPLEELLVRQASLEIDAAPTFTGQLDQVLIHAQVDEHARIRLAARSGAGEVVHDAGREQVDGLALVARLADGELAVERLAFNSSLLTLRASDAALEWPITPEGSYRGQLQLSTDLAKLAALPHGLSLPPIEGKLSLRGSVHGTGKALEAKVDVDGDPVLDGFGFGRLALKVELDRHELRLMPGSVGYIAMDGGEVGLEGRLGFEPSLPLEVSADVRHLDFHKLMAQLGVTQDCLVNWVLRGGFKLSGTVVPVAISGPIWAEHVSFRALTSAYHDPSAREVIGTPPGRVAGRVAIRPDALRFENLEGRLPNSTMTVTVHVGFDDRIGVTARSDNLDLRDATSLMGMAIEGRGAFTLDVGGTYSNTTLTGTLDLADFALDGYRIGHLKTRAVLEKGGLAVRFVDTHVQKANSRYQVEDLLLDFTRAFSIDAKGTLGRLALADFYHTFLLEDDPDFAPYQGHVSGPVRVRYTLGYPGDQASGTLVVSTDLEVLDVRAHGVPFKGGRLEGTWIWRDIRAGTRGARLELSELLLRKGRGSVVARGTMDLGGKLAMTVFAERLTLGDVDALRDLGVEFAGELGAAGTVRGTLWVPEVALNVHAVGAQVARRTLGDAHLSMFVTHRDDPWVQKALGELPPGEPCPEARRAVARANWDGGSNAFGPLPPRAYLVCGPAFGKRLNFDVAVGHARGIPVRGRLAFERLSPSLLWPRGQAELPLTGNLDGFVALTGGEFKHPDSLVGALEISHLRLGHERAQLTSDGPVRIALTGLGARIEQARFVGSGTQIKLSGGASMQNGLATSVEGLLDLGVLPAFVGSVSRAGGQLAINVKLTGAPTRPSVFGQARLSQGSLLLTGSDQLLDKVEAKLSFSEREVLLESMRAQVAGGHLSAHGSLALAGEELRRYELFVKARDINYSPLANVELSFAADTKLAYDGSRRIPELTGTLRILRARYKRPFSLGLTERLSGLSQAKRVTRENYDPSKDRIAFDLRVVEDAPLRVNNNLMNAELSIEDSERPFRIVGTDQRLGVLGTLEVTRGSVMFRNTEFTLEEGTITFIDEHRVRPRLDVHARTNFRRQADASGANWWITLKATGEVDDLKVETTSEPALTQEDIALLLTVGLTRAEAERLGTAELTQGAALEALATVTGVDREVRKALPVIDDFAVTSAYSARTNRTEPQVVVGKRLSDRVRASATTGLTADSNFKTGVEWRLDNQTSVEAGYDNVQTTTSSQFGNVGVDLRWRLEFD